MSEGYACGHHLQEVAGADADATETAVGGGSAVYASTGWFKGKKKKRFCVEDLRIEGRRVFKGRKQTRTPGRSGLPFSPPTEPTTVGMRDFNTISLTIFDLDVAHSHISPRTSLFIFPAVATLPESAA